MKRINIAWTDEEKKFVLKRVLEDKVHPWDVWPECNARFKRNRSYGAVKSFLTDHSISYSGLVRKGAQGGDNKIEVEQYTEEQMREELSKRGYKVEKREEAKTDRRFKIDTSKFEGDTIKIAIISCSQLGSKYQQLTYLRDFYKYFQGQGGKIVLHCGDMVDGEKMYRGQEYELFLHGAKAQKDYCIENYPRMENGGKTHVIMGNHDESFWKHNGIDALEDIAKEREDIVYHGRWGAYPKINDLSIYMAHGTGGVSYARTYRLQKLIEQFSPAQKPDFYFIGHWHVSTALFMYRNVTAFMTPCFQSQTPYLKGKGLYPEIGGFIMDITTNDTFRKKGTAKVKFEYVPFYVPKENDY